MSGASSSAVEWFSLLQASQSSTDFQPVLPGPDGLEIRPTRPDDPRLGDIVQLWRGDADALRPGRAVLVGFPQDEGVRRNRGRPGAALAPTEIRRRLYSVTPWDGTTDRDLTSLPPLDAGDVRIEGPLEQTQEALAQVVAGILIA